MASKPVPVVLASVKGKPVRDTVGFPATPDPLATESPEEPDTIETPVKVLELVLT
jgi:hypothetical protein